MLLIIADEARRHYGRELCSRLWDEDNVRRRTLWGLFDSLKNMFAHHEHHHGASIGQSLTLADAEVNNNLVW